MSPNEKLKELEARRALYFTRAEKIYEKQVAQVMRDALDDIRTQMSKIYEKYSVNGVLTKAQMTQYNRLATLEANIQATMKTATKTATKIIDKLKPEEYGEAFFRTSWAVDNATGVGLTWGPLDKKAIVENLDNPFFDSAKKSLWFNATNRVPSTISNGLALGQSYTEMMKDLKGMVNKENFEIMRVLRTELHSAQEAGTLDSYTEALNQGVNGKIVWIATLDGRTRDSHAAMDGVARDEDGYFRGEIGQALYPGDPNLPAGERISCRCDTRLEIEGFEPVVRRSKEDGIIPYQTYDEWSKDRKVFK